MSLLVHPFSLMASRRAAAPVQGTLAAGRTLSLQADADVRVQVTQGRLWLTLDGPGHGALDGLGDWFLGAGQEFTVPAGRRAVIEPWVRAGEAGAQFSLARVDRPVTSSCDGWHRLLQAFRPGPVAAPATWGGQLCQGCAAGR